MGGCAKNIARTRNPLTLVLLAFTPLLQATPAPVRAWHLTSAGTPSSRPWQDLKGRVPSWRWF